MIGLQTRPKSRNASSPEESPTTECTSPYSPEESQLMNTHHGVEILNDVLVKR